MPQSHRASSTLLFKDNKELNQKKVTTLKKLTITKKEPYNKALSKNGASNGLNFEPYCVKLAHYSLHDEYSINTIKMLLQLE